MIAENRRGKKNPDPCWLIICFFLLKDTVLSDNFLIAVLCLLICFNVVVFSGILFFKIFRQSSQIRWIVLRSRFLRIDFLILGGNE